MLELRHGHAEMSNLKLTARTALLPRVPPLLWAGNAVVGRPAVGSVQPLTLNFFAMDAGAAHLVALGLARAVRAESNHGAQVATDAVGAAGCRAASDDITVDTRRANITSKQCRIAQATLWLRLAMKWVCR